MFWFKASISTRPFQTSLISKREKCWMAVNRFLFLKTIVSREEVVLIFKLFQSIKSRSVEDGIDKEGFHHFCQMPVSTSFFACIPEYRVCGDSVFGINSWKHQEENSLILTNLYTAYVSTLQIKVFVLYRLGCKSSLRRSG